MNGIHEIYMKFSVLNCYDLSFGPRRVNCPMQCMVEYLGNGHWLRQGVWGLTQQGKNAFRIFYEQIRCRPVHAETHIHLAVPSLTLKWIATNFFSSNLLTYALLSSTVWPLCNTIIFLYIHKRHSIPRLWGWGMECLLWIHSLIYILYFLLSLYDIALL